MDRGLIIAITVAIVEGLKRKGLNTTFAPFASIGVAVVLNLINRYLYSDVFSFPPVLLEGIILGLTASGAYDGIKSISILAKANLLASRG